MFQTIRHRRHRAKKGQVAAVATILGLLLVVSFIANFILVQLPDEMATLEFEHVVQVENQLSRLQATILAQAGVRGSALVLSNPITLGSQAAPPFGPPAQGSISPEPDSTQTSGSYSVSKVIPHPPRWNIGDGCATGTGKPCSGNSNVYYYNYSSTNNTTLNIKVTGGNNTLVYNFSGNNNTINIQALGNSVSHLIAIINGSDTVVNFQKGGSSNKNPVASFFFFGERDVMNLDPSAAKNGNIAINVTFVGTLNQLCPYGNISATDRVGTLGTAGGSGLTVNVSWWNADGYQSGPHTQTYPGGVAGQTISWFNKTGFVACAFTQSFTSSYSAIYAGGLAVHLLNRYSPGADVAFDQGAVILAQQGGAAIMVSPPKLSLTTYPSGNFVSLTLVNFVGNMSSDAGVTTSAITTHILATHQLRINPGAGGYFLSSPLFLNLTTAYPTAWITFFAQHPTIFPGGSNCLVTTKLVAPYTCVNPAPGTTETVMVGVFAQTLQVNDITVQAAIE